MTRLREVSAAVAEAVARAEGLSDVPLDGLPDWVREARWEPAYPKVEAM